MRSEGLANGLRPALNPLLSFEPLGIEDAGAPFGKLVKTRLH